MYWLPAAVALALVLLVLMYAIRRYRGSGQFRPKNNRVYRHPNGGWFKTWGV